MPRIRRWLVFTAIVLLLVIGGVASVSVGSVRQSFPQLAGRLTVPGLTGPVEVLRDAYGVPQIYADRPEDLFEAQGFVQAQDRFYEMDVRRHIAAGRLSELFGESQVETDAYIRTLGWRRVAEQELPLLAPSTRRYLDAYAAGVNSYLRSRSAGALSLEYTLLGAQGLAGYVPEEWTPADSVSWLKVMAWNLGSNLDQETELGQVSAVLGPGRAATLFPDYPLDGMEPILGRGAVVGKAFDPQATRSSERPLPGLSRGQLRAAEPTLARIAKLTESLPRAVRGPGAGAVIGSNSWVVAGSRTASGSAILSNDPHLDTSIPSVFGQIGLHCRAVSTSCPFDVAGFTLAAVPGVVIGHNNSISWGLTTSYADVQDLYLEDVVGDSVREGNTYVPLTVVTEQIKVQGQEQPRTIRIRSSRHGPLLSDVSTQLQQVGAASAPPSRDAYAVALAWTALTPGRTMDALLAIDLAQNFKEFQQAAALLAAPSQNLVYADRAGNIGYQLPGAIPIRGKGDGVTPSPGWDRAYDWKGTIPAAELPYAYNPPSGFIVAANQQIIGQYPHRLGSDYSYGWRSQQLVDRLRDADPLTMDSAEQLFYDTTMRIATDVVPSLLKVKVSDSWVLEGQRTLVGWDYRADSDSAAAAYFNVVLHDLRKLSFRDELAEDLWPTGDQWYGVLSTLMHQPRNPWWDDTSTKDKVETRDDILLAAMTAARKEITSLMARDSSRWEWGKLHTVTLRNSTLGRSGIGPVEKLFNRGPYPVGGGMATVDALAFDDSAGYAVTSGPTMRMLVDLGKLDDSRWVNQSGVSGHAFSRNYDDQTQLWVSDRMWPFVFSRQAVDARTTNRLELAPGG